MSLAKQFHPETSIQLVPNYSVEVTADLSFCDYLSVCVVSDNFPWLRPGHADADHVSMSGTSRKDEQNCNIYDYTFIIKDNVMDEVSETGAE